MSDLEGARTSVTSASATRIIAAHALLDEVEASALALLAVAPAHQLAAEEVLTALKASTGRDHGAITGAIISLANRGRLSLEADGYVRPPAETPAPN
jgi:hypothetical protein